MGAGGGRREEAFLLFVTVQTWAGGKSALVGLLTLR